MFGFGRPRRRKGIHELSSCPAPFLDMDCARQLLWHWLGISFRFRPADGRGAATRPHRFRPRSPASSAPRGTWPCADARSGMARRLLELDWRPARVGSRSLGEAAAGPSLGPFPLGAEPWAMESARWLLGPALTWALVSRPAGPGDCWQQIELSGSVANEWSAFCGVGKAV